MLYTLFIQSTTNVVQYFEFEAADANDAIVKGFDAFMQQHTLNKKEHKVIGLGADGTMLFWMYPLDYHEGKQHV